MRGQPPARRLFIPLVFTLAAKLEDIALPIFLTNPTKIANALTAIHSRLHTDGVVGYYDLTLVAEALGCRLDWHTIPPTIAAPRADESMENIQLSPQELKSRGRIPVALEVVRRLHMTLRDESALLVGLPGPLRLAQQLFGNNFAVRLVTGDSDTWDTFDTLTEMTLHLSQAFCLAGTHLVLFDEAVIPPDVLQRWKLAMSPLWNTIRFHEALPLLCTDTAIQAGHLGDGPLFCLKPWQYDESPLPEHSFALALPAAEALPVDITRWVSSNNCVLITTDGELPYQMEIQNLQRLVTEMRTIPA